MLRLVPGNHIRETGSGGERLDNRSAERRTNSAMHDGDRRMKVVGRRRPPARPDLRYAAPLLELAVRLRGTRPYIPKGVHVFRSFEEADQWSLQMMTRLRCGVR
jgi:hypothetical protein